MSDNIETDRLGKRTALTDGDDISVLDRECRRAMSGNILVSLFKATVFSNVVQVVSADNDCSLHLGGDDLSLEDSSANRDISREWTFLVNVRILKGRIGGLDTQTNILDETHGLLAGRTDGTFTSDKDSILLLVRLFVLIALDVFLGNSNHLFLF